MKRIVALSLAVLMLFALAACGSNEGDITNGKKPNNQAVNGSESGFLFKGDSDFELGTPSETLDPKTIYNSIEYTHEMFYGDYSIRGKSDAWDAFGAEYEYFTWTKDDSEYKYTVLPFRIQAGEHTFAHVLNYIEEYNWARLYFMRQYDNGSCGMETIYCAYTVEDKKVIFKPIDEFEYNEDNKTLTYSFTDQVWEYDFEFSGRYLTLSKGNASVKLETGLDAYRETDYFSVHCYLSPNSKNANGIDSLDLVCDVEDGTNYAYFDMVNGEWGLNGVALLEENGLITLTVQTEETTFTRQYVYFYCDNDGMILADKKGVYYYNDNYSDRNKNTINEYITEDQTEKLEDLTDSQLEDIVTTTKSLIEELETAFNEAGIKVTINKTTGEIAMDASVLFGGDSAVLTDEGKAFLDEFVNVYAKIIFDEKYNGIVSKTMVEGHTAPVSGSTYESGLPLSEERAENVKAYCVSAVSGENATALGNSLESVGYSNSKPVKDADGNVDMAASRRVSFRFIIDLDKIV